MEIKARDATSGVAKMQIGPNKSKATEQDFQRSVAVNTSAKQVYLRVFENAGNASRWHTVLRADEPHRRKKHHKKHGR